MRKWENRKGWFRKLWQEKRTNMGRRAIVSLVDYCDEEEPLKEGEN
jgi:hypothetical protein